MSHRDPAGVRQHEISRSLKVAYDLLSSHSRRVWLIFSSSRRMLGNGIVASSAKKRQLISQKCAAPEIPSRQTQNGFSCVVPTSPGRPSLDRVQPLGLSSGTSIARDSGLHCHRCKSIPVAMHTSQKGVVRTQTMQDNSAIRHM